jgi:hypothetical protein
MQTIKYMELNKTMKTQLLCTFSTKQDLEKHIDLIKSNYELAYNYIYILQNKNIPNELFVTYNVVVENEQPNLEMKTILVHRKKQSNTLYTINALNNVIMEATGGQLDNKFEVDWEKYRNCILVTNTEGVKKIYTRVFDVIDLTK